MEDRKPDRVDAKGLRWYGLQVRRSGSDGKLVELEQRLAALEEEDEVDDE